MAKQKPKAARVRKKPEPIRFGDTTDTRRVQRVQLARSAETYTKHAIECFVCGERDSERDMTLAEYAKGLYEDGWRYVNSATFQTIGAVCRKCAATPDAKRGDD
jgi:hypothetical protein